MLIGARTGVWSGGGKRGGIPSGWVEVEYLICYGSQYINTNYVPNSNTRFVGRFRQTTSANSVLFGSRQSTDRYSYVVWSFLSGKSRCRYDYLGYGSSSAQPIVQEGSSVSVGVDYSIEKDGEKNYLNDVAQTSNGRRGYFSTGFNAYIGALNNGGSSSFGFVGWLYPCKIYDGAVPIRDYVAVRNAETNEGAMCDVLTGDIYRNQGTGAFVAGPDKV